TQRNLKNPSSSSSNISRLTILAVSRPPSRLITPSFSQNAENVTLSSFLQNANTINITINNNYARPDEE
ncbi:2429_t:CDS:1, partial [Funneliformis mosseae]